MSSEAEAVGKTTSEKGRRTQEGRRDRLDLRPRLLLSLVLLLLVVGGGAKLLGLERIAQLMWTAAVLPVEAVLLVQIVQTLRRGEIGLDIVAALSMGSALAVGETLAAAVVALMYAGGQFLEAFAQARARRELRGLLGRVPRTATRLVGPTAETVLVEAIRPGDRLMIRRGDAVPVDGNVEAGEALLDQSSLTGEPLPVRIPKDGAAMSGSVNVGEAFVLGTRLPAAESTYAGIVRLVDQAEASKAPMSRLADRYSLGFLGLTLTFAGAAYALSQDVVRSVAVLVVATPCPLILAVPVALVAGVSRSAGLGVLVKGAAPLEALARIRSVVMDKTGTLTEGRPGLLEVRPEGSVTEAELLRLAASAEQGSTHPMAAAIVAAARERGLPLVAPIGISEVPGHGLCADVEGRTVCVGSRRFVAGCLNDRPGALRHDPEPASVEDVDVCVAIDGRIAGSLVMMDLVRPAAGALLTRLRALGIRRIVLATGDRRAVAEAVGSRLGLDAVKADLTPTAKVDAVKAARGDGPVMMVGDGVNDAPALAAADVGVAMGARGAAASSEVADVVLVGDDLARLADGMEIAIGARRLAVQSVVAGIGLSTTGMIAATFGYLPPLQGALLQEAIDVAVVMNALRAAMLKPASWR